MDKLNFYIADLNYVRFLKNSEFKKRGFTRVPNLDYDKKRKPKFLCGVVLKIDEFYYYVPVSSFKLQKPDNFLIKADNGQIVSSLRFNYMFPIPTEMTSIRQISTEPDHAYRALLSQELRYCIKNQVEIERLAMRTYKRVIMGKDKGLVENSCDFILLEQRCRKYKENLKNIKEHNIVNNDEKKPGIFEDLERIRQEQEAARKKEPKPPNISPQSPNSESGYTYSTKI